MTFDPAALAGRPIIIGGGLAGLTVALALAPRPVVVLTKRALGVETASSWAQGGLAAAILPGDSPSLHAADTIEAGDGLTDPEVARRITAQGPDTVAWLDALGTRFARDAGGEFACKLEAAHSRRRVLNAGGDGSGAEIMRAVVAAVRRTPTITVIESATACDLVTDHQGLAGMVVAIGGGRHLLPTRTAAIASGGAGGLWRDTTNPPGALGQGLALAARAGAELLDLEFMQFHPTALDSGQDPMPLLSEAVRGDGGLLIDEHGNRFMTGYARAELEPRDVVARAVWAEIVAGHRPALDTRAAFGDGFVRRFPKAAAECARAGIDPTAQPIPIRPAAHYHMGGIAVDARGRSTIPGLWACGEAASTGLHGANRLASNSLLEAVVCGREVAADIHGRKEVGPAVSPPPPGLAHQGGGDTSLRIVRGLMTDHVGVIRSRDGLATALRALLPLVEHRATRDAATTALMIAAAAIRREESRGGHYRSDFAAADKTAITRQRITLDAALARARGI